MDKDQSIEAVAWQQHSPANVSHKYLEINKHMSFCDCYVYFTRFSMFSMGKKLNSRGVCVSMGTVCVICNQSTLKNCCFFSSLFPLHIGHCTTGNGFYCACVCACIHPTAAFYHHQSYFCIQVFLNFGL